MIICIFFNLLSPSIISFIAGEMCASPPATARQFARHVRTSPRGGHILSRTYLQILYLIRFMRNTPTSLATLSYLMQYQCKNSVLALMGAFVMFTIAGVNAAPLTSSQLQSVIAQNGDSGYVLTEDTQEESEEDLGEASYNTENCEPAQDEDTDDADDVEALDLDECGNEIK